MADIEWITLNTTAGTGNSAVTLSVPAWTGTTDRSVRLTVAVPGSMLSDTVTVTQTAALPPADGQFYIIIRELSDSGTDGVVCARTENTLRVAFDYSVDGEVWQNVAEGGQLSITSALINIPIYLRFSTNMGWLRFENIENIELGGSMLSANRVEDHGWHAPLGTKYLDDEIYKCIKKVDNLLIDTEFSDKALSYSSISVPPAFPNRVNTSLSDGVVYDNLFYGCASLLDGPVFPTAVSYCFSAHACFRDCTSLTGTPVLPATVEGALGGILCNSMFYGCTSLKTPPTLPSLVTGASTSSSSIVLTHMFSSCSALTDGIVFPEEVDGQLIVNSMYANCDSLVRVPPLPKKVSGTFNATQMFYGCISLTDGPSLPSEISGTVDISGMYGNCYSLTGASINFPLNLIPEYDYGDMFSGNFPLSGILKVRSDETGSDDDIRDRVGLPSGWTIQRVL